MTARHFARAATLAIMLLAIFMNRAPAASEGDSRLVGNIQIYLGVLPAEMILGLHPISHVESTMHGGSPSGTGEYHLTIALFDATTKKRISGADVRARVAEIGLGGEEKRLQPMEIAGTETYGNYFPMPGHGPFRIFLSIRVPGQKAEVKTQFEHWHQ